MALQAIPPNERASVFNKFFSPRPGKIKRELFGFDDVNLRGNDLDNILIGNDGNNVIDGLGGADTMAGSGGNDNYVVDNKGDQVVEFFEEGDETAVSFIRKYKLPSNVERLVFEESAGKAIGIGNSLDNGILGNDSKNKLKGGGGDDVLIGLGGKDKLTGGSGSDQFQFLSITDSGISKKTRDVITDFTPGVDFIVLSPIDAKPFANGDRAFEFIGSAQFSDFGQARFANGILSLNIDDDFLPEFEVELKGVNQLFASDIIL